MWTHRWGQVIGSTVAGVNPVFKPVLTGPNAQASFAFVNMPAWVEKGQTFDITVSITDGRNIRGYSFDLLFNSNLIAPASNSSHVTEFLGAQTISMLREFDPGKMSVANFQLGRPDGISGSGDVAVITFQALADDRPGIALDAGYVINPLDQVSGVGLTLVNGIEVVPTDFTLDGRVDLVDYAELVGAMGGQRNT
jgi:hypothetical protein